MPSKEPTREDVERKLEALDVFLAQHDKDFPPDEHDDDDLDFYGIGKVDRSPFAARNKGRTIDEILADAGRSALADADGVRPGEGSNAPPENMKLQNEIEIESKPVPKPRRKRGQRTKRGQLIASRNATKHGIISNAPVVDDFETMDAWHEHLQGIHESIDPQSPLEESLTFRLAGVLWRLNRVTRHETASIKMDIADRRQSWEENEDALADLGEPPGDPEELKTKIDYDALPDNQTVDKVIKYETSLHRQSLQLLHELEAFAARRSGQPTPLARLDVSEPPA